jgi:hypothetical protein
MQKWHAAAPPLEVRREGYPLSFDHCCELLEWPADEIRANGIRIARNGSITAYGWGWGGLSSWRQWRSQRKQAQRIREAGHQASVERQRMKTKAAAPQSNDELAASVKSKVFRPDSTAGRLTALRNLSQ